MNPYSSQASRLITEFETDPQKGLSLSEAEKRKKQYGENRLREKKKKSAICRFLDQF